MIKLFFTLFLIIVTGCTTTKKQRQFEVLKIEGWNVYLEREIYNDSKQLKNIKEILELKLHHIKEIIPVNSLHYIQQIKIWVSNEANYPFREKEYSSFVYHVSSSWLELNGLPAKFENGIHLINPDHFINKAKNFVTQPMVVLHELSHAFHYGCLKIENNKIHKAFNNAVKNKLYLLVNRVNSDKKEKAYAISNHKEYFAELTEAYFGKNDFFPFNKKELERYDPKGHKAIYDSWHSPCSK